jgi:hypothetical protein
MAQQFNSPDFGTLVVPSAVALYNVQASNAGLAASGIVMLVGEADAGPDYTLETGGIPGGAIDLTANSFGPTQLGAVIAKYQSGPLVDAMRAFVNPSNDPNITGAPTAFIIAKTNPSGQAKGGLLDWDSEAYGTLGALVRGAGGNNISYTVLSPTAQSSTATGEEVPTTGAFTMAVPISTFDYNLRVNGGAAQTSGGVAGGTTPDAFVTSLNTLTGVVATGGVNRAIIQAGSVGQDTLSLAIVSGNQVTITIAQAGTGPGVFGALVKVGDTLWIPTGTALSSTQATNAGTYIVTAAGTTTTIQAWKITNATGTPGAAPTTPVAVSAQTVTSNTSDAADLNDYSQVNISVSPHGTTITSGSNAAVLPQATINVASTAGFPTSGFLNVVTALGIQVVSYTGVTGTSFTGCQGGLGAMTTGGQVVLAEPVDGLGKSLELAALTAGPDNWTNLAWNLVNAVPTKVTFLSTAAEPEVITSEEEYQASMQVDNVVSNLQETLTAGGDIGLQISYEGTTAQAVINATSIILSWTGGPNAGSPLTLLLSNFPSISALASYINAQKGFTATPGSGIIGLLPSSALDEGTFTIGSTFGALTGRIKIDAYRWLTRAIGQSVQVGMVAPLPVAGLPAPEDTMFLAGGTRGGSTDANITGAIDALQNVQGNFLVPIFSQDASLDIIAGTTDPSSTYDIASINAYAKTHVLLMSQPKRKGNRQACLSVNDTFDNDQTSASNIASFRCTMCFQSVQNTGSTGALQFFQPWMAAGLAASMQAAGFYKGIVNKYANCNSITDSSGDYNDQDVDAQTEALLAGLLPMRRDLSAGGVLFVSDQTTYGSDSNFVYNSLQAVYVADTMALTLAQRMQKAFVGQSVADISASQAVAFVKNILTDFLTLKLIAPSIGAPKGYQPGSIVVNISGTAMTVNLSVFLAGLIYFVPITFQINQVQQTASA